MRELQRTAFYDRHTSQKAKFVEFGGWEMPIHYSSGIVAEHLATRKGAGLFDVSHMGRFVVRGKNALDFLQHALTNNAAALDTEEIGAQYTILSNASGGAIDDAYLYRFDDDEYLLVVNAANRLKDWSHLQTLREGFDDVQMTDCTEQTSMLALQGPDSRMLLGSCIESGQMPEPMRNRVSRAKIGGAEVSVARTGYTGEPLCFELFAPREIGLALWDRFLTEGATPVGLGARDTLRLEAGLPLYGHEFGEDDDGKEIPLLAVPLAKFAVSFSPLKGDFVGRQALEKQFKALSGIIERDYSHIADLPRMITPVAVTGRGIARSGAEIFNGDTSVGHVTSGTMVPYWPFEGEGLSAIRSENRQLRSLCLAYIDSDIIEDTHVTIDIRGKAVDAVVVPFHLKSDAPPYARPIVIDHEMPESIPNAGAMAEKVHYLLEKSVQNTRWRQQECMNLIPSEMTVSPMVRLLSVMDPAYRYAEHRELEAFYDTDIFFYQGTEFIGEVEQRLEEEMQKYLGCEAVDMRLISGQMANTAVFSAMVDYINRADRRQEPRRIRRIMNNHIGKGGHLSAQPMGALRDFVARDPRTERPAVTNFPVLTDNPYMIDVAAAMELIDIYRPELIVFGKSMVLHREPIAEIRRYLDDQGIQGLVLYDIAHVLGLVGPYFQEPFRDGADLVTGSTHKTYFGTQRGLVGSRFREEDVGYELWEAIRRRAFPGSVSNHHLGTLLGLLMAAYEMNAFRDVYQPAVLANGKAFARALSDCGLAVAGDPSIDFTETHQVIVNVGYGQGPDMARRLEANNIICNYQAAPDEEGFTASGSLRFGVSEMTRFGMRIEDFQALAVLIKEVIADDVTVTDPIKALRGPFCKLQFCFSREDHIDLVEQLHGLL